MVFIKGHKFHKGGEKGWFKKGAPSGRKGISLSKEHKEKLRQAKLKNPVRHWLGKKRTPYTWKNHNIGYAGLHARIKKILKKPKRCSNCKKILRLCLSNISGKYLDLIFDWVYLCYKCHYILDRSRKSIITKHNGHLKLPR